MTAALARFGTAARPGALALRGRGFALAYILAGCALLAALGVAAFSYFYPVLKTSHARTLQTRTERTLMQGAYLLAVAATDSDGDGMPEPPAYTSTSFAPAGGGAVPAVNNGPQTDAWGRALGYCAWDNGSTNTSADRLTGDNPGSGTSIALAVISAGPDGVFQSTCNGIKSGTVSGDDQVRTMDVELVRQAVNGTVYYGDAVASATALNSIPTAGLPDGQIRLKLDDNTIWRWNSSAAAWQQVSLGTVSSTPGRNFLINGNFDIWQRGTSFNVGTSNIYTADRWGGDISGTNATYSQVAVNSSDTNAPQGARYALQLAPSAGTTYWELYQPIENLRQFSGQTLTISFYARNTLYNASTNYTDFAVTLVSAFGSGGSSWVYTTDGKTYTPTATWTQYTVTLTVPDMSSKTFGTAGTDMLELVISENMNTGTPNLQFAQAQVESGSAATPFDLRPPAYERMLCARYYQVHNDGDIGSLESAYVPAYGTFSRLILFSVPMRAVPTVTITKVTGTNIAGTPTATNVTAQGFAEKWKADSTSNTMRTFSANWTADAEY